MMAVIKTFELTSRGVALKKIPCFSELSDRSLQKIDATALHLNFQPGEQILSRIDEGDEMYVLISGLAQVVIFSACGKTVGFRRINPGDIFGEFSAIDGRKRSAAVEAVYPCHVLRLPSGLLWELLRQEPTFTAAILKHLTTILRDLTARIYEFSTLAVKNRIQAELLRMAKKDTRPGGVHVISPAPTHTEIASRISTHREAVSRELSRLAKLGIIRKDRRSLIVQDLARLERLVRDASDE